VTLAGGAQVGEDDQVQFEEEDLDSLDDLDDDIDLGETSGDSLEAVTKVDPDAQARIDARHEIERRNELKALQSELDEWDDIDEEDL